MRWAFRAVVITVSDRGARGEREDGSGPEIAGMLQAAGMEIVGRRIIPDEKEMIRQASHRVERRRRVPT